MKLIALCGFLGSGKTTLLLSLARHLSSDGQKKIAIVENEVGSIGIDQSVVKNEGFQVRELFSGCICCSLRTDLVTTVLELERTEKPDIVILEASGVAAPPLVLDAFKGYSGSLETITSMVLIDLGRLEQLCIFSLPFVQASIGAADVVVVNKADMAGDCQLEEARDEIGAINSDASIHVVSAKNDTGMGELFETIDRGMASSTPAEAPQVKGNHHSQRDAKIQGVVTSAYTTDVTIDGAQRESSIVEAAKTSVEAIAHALCSQGCTMIGHIKMMLIGPDSGYALVSVVSEGQQADMRGGFTRTPQSLSVTVNAIVYGIPQGQVDSIVAEKVDGLVERLGRE